MGNHRWTLKLDEIHPGLYWREGSTLAKLLALHSIAARGLRDNRAFEGVSLIEVAQHRGRLEASFAPARWDGLRIRASWSRAPIGEGVDLEIQLQATTAEVIGGVEVGIISEWGQDRSATPSCQVEPRDIRSAGSTYDGRETADMLRTLTTLPVPATSPHPLMPQIFTPRESIDEIHYVEMIPPNDCARRIRPQPLSPPSGPRPGFSMRYELFGHDLEKGVVLRARLRGLWIHSQSPEQEAWSAYREFLSEPPSLGP